MSDCSSQSAGQSATNGSGRNIARGVDVARLLSKSPCQVIMKFCGASPACAESTTAPEASYLGAQVILTRSSRPNARPIDVCANRACPRIRHVIALPNSTGTRMTVVAFSCVQSRMSGVTSTEQISMIEKSTFKTRRPQGLCLPNQTRVSRLGSCLRELLCKEGVFQRGQPQPPRLGSCAARSHLEMVTALSRRPMIP